MYQQVQNIIQNNQQNIKQNESLMIMDKQNVSSQFNENLSLITQINNKVKDQIQLQLNQLQQQLNDSTQQLAITADNNFAFAMRKIDNIESNMQTSALQVTYLIIRSSSSMKPPDTSPTLSKHN